MIWIRFFLARRWKTLCYLCGVYLHHQFLCIPCWRQILRNCLCFYFASLLWWIQDFLHVFFYLVDLFWHWWASNSLFMEHVIKVFDVVTVSQWWDECCRMLIAPFVEVYLLLLWSKLQVWSMSPLWLLFDTKFVLFFDLTYKSCMLWEEFEVWDHFLCSFYRVDPDLLFGKKLHAWTPPHLDLAFTQWKAVFSSCCSQ